MKQTDFEPSYYIRELRSTRYPTECRKNSLTFNYLNNRCFILLSCVLLNLAEAKAMNTKNGLGDQHLWVLIQCLKRLKVKDSKDGVTCVIERPEWRVGDLEAALILSAKCLSFR